MIITSDSELYESIVQSINEFDFSDYGLDEIEDIKQEDHAREWIHALAAKIEKDWVEYVDGLT